MASVRSWCQLVLPSRGNSLAAAGQSVRQLELYGSPRQSQAALGAAGDCAGRRSSLGATAAFPFPARSGAIPHPASVPSEHGSAPVRPGFFATAATTDLARAPAAEDSVSLPGQPGDEYFAADTRPVVLYDGVCNFCNAGVNFLLDSDPEGKLRLAALQSPAGRLLLQRSGRSPDDISSIVLVERDRSFVKSEAVLRIGQYLNTPLAALAPLALLAPRIVGDSAYDVVATNRYNILGRRDACRVDDGRFSDRFLTGDL